jgi:hypothetical protein
MFTTSHSNTALRNYALLAAVVVITSLGLTDVFTNPSRVAQQDRLDGYTQYVGAGLVTAAQSFVR